MNFWLVQRMIRNAAHQGSITDTEHLVPDYMGAAEFEFGALPRAYQAMKKLSLSITKISVKAYDVETTLYVVAPIDHAEKLQSRFQAWADRKFHSCEEPNLRAAIIKKDWANHFIEDEWYQRYYPQAWWEIKEKIFFSIKETVFSL